MKLLARWELLMLKIKTLIPRLKIRFLKNKVVISPYEKSKDKFIWDLSFLIVGIKVDMQPEILHLVLKNLINSNFLLYGVENREFKDFLLRIKLPVSPEEKNDILNHLQKIAELVSF